MDSVVFRVNGKPVPKGSVTRMPNGAYLPAGNAASRMHFQIWKENIASAARVAMGERQPWMGPVRFKAELQIPAPSGIKKTDWGWIPHVKKPDIDKLTRALFDPLKGIVWGDDSQVSFCAVNKVYAWNGQPGAVIVVDFLSPEWCASYGAAHQKIADLLHQKGAYDD